MKQGRAKFSKQAEWKDSGNKKVKKTILPLFHNIFKDLYYGTEEVIRKLARRKAGASHYVNASHRREKRKTTVTYSQPSSDQCTSILQYHTITKRS